MRTRYFIGVALVFAAIFFAGSGFAAPTPPPSVVGQWTIVKGSLTASIGADLFTCTTYPNCLCGPGEETYPDCQGAEGSKWAFKDLVDVSIKVPNLNAPCALGICDTFIFYDDYTFNDTIGLLVNTMGITSTVTWAQDKANLVVSLPIQEMVDQLKAMKIDVTAGKYGFTGKTSIGTVNGEKTPMIKGKLELILEIHDHLASETNSIIKAVVKVSGAFEGWYAGPPETEDVAVAGQSTAQQSLLGAGAPQQAIDAIVKDLILKAIPEAYRN